MNPVPASGMVMINAIAGGRGRREDEPIIAVAPRLALRRGWQAWRGVSWRKSFVPRWQTTGLRQWLRWPMLVVAEAGGCDAARCQARKLSPQPRR